MDAEDSVEMEACENAGDGERAGPSKVAFICRLTPICHCRILMVASCLGAYGFLIGSEGTVCSPVGMRILMTSSSSFTAVSVSDM